MGVLGGVGGMGAMASMGAMGGGMGGMGGMAATESLHVALMFALLFSELLTCRNVKRRSLTIYGLNVFFLHLHDGVGCGLIFASSVTSGTPGVSMEVGTNVSG